MELRVAGGGVRGSEWVGCRGEMGRERVRLSQQQPAKVFSRDVKPPRHTTDVRKEKKKEKTAPTTPQYISSMSGVLGLVSRLAIPAAIGVSLFQLSIYDVKGGSRAVIFDRLSGVKETVCSRISTFLREWNGMNECSADGECRWSMREPTSSSRGCRRPSSTTSAPSPGISRPPRAPRTCRWSV